MSNLCDVKEVQGIKGTEVIVETVKDVNMTTQKEIVMCIFFTQFAEVNHVVSDIKGNADSGRQRKAGSGESFVSISTQIETSINMKSHTNIEEETLKKTTMMILTV